jgi:hypothetical protein
MENKVFRAPRQAPKAKSQKPKAESRKPKAESDSAIIASWTEAKSFL